MAPPPKTTPPPCVLLLLCLAALLASAGCQGDLESQSRPVWEAGGSEGLTPEEGRVPASGDTTGADPAHRPDMMAQASQGDMAAPAKAYDTPYYLRRLTPREMRVAMERAMGLEVSQAMEVVFPEDIRHSHFDNDASGLTTSAEHVEAWHEAASFMAKRAAESGAWRKRVEEGCAPQAPESQGCLRHVLTTTAKALWRTEPDQARIEAYVAFVNGETDVWVKALELGLVALLQSPQFLYRVEQGLAQDAKDEQVPLSDEEWLVRLTFLLWGSGPEGEDLARAAAGLSPQERLAVFEASWEHSYAKDWLGHYIAQRFELGKLDGVQVSSKRYPEFTNAASSAMKQEVIQVVQDHMFGSMPYLDLHQADYGYVHKNLEAWYGARKEGVKEEFARHSWPKESHRVGMVTLPGIMAMTGRDAGTSAISRGEYVRKVLLCQTLPDPPDFVPNLPKTEGLSERARLELHRSDPACQGCHTLLDPLGFGFEHFDAVGKTRQKDSADQKIDDSGNFAGLRDPEFDGTAGLAQKLRHHPDLALCEAKQFFSFAQGRPYAHKSLADASTVKAMAAALERPGGSFKSMVQVLILSDSFGTVRHPKERP